MSRTHVLGLIAALCVAACVQPSDGDDGVPADCVGKCDGQGGAFLAKLNALPGVTAVQVWAYAESTYYELTFRQPVDHEAPGGAKFEQRVSLLHRDPSAPMVVLTSGYWDWYGSQTFELTDLLDANQVSIEHRFFGESRPQPADWSKLTIKQMADDQHAIITALRTLYDGAFVTTGASKGGMTAVYHRRFYPDDVEGTVPYVAPLSFGAPDERYAPFMDAVGPAGCRQNLRALAIEMLRSRRAALVARATEQARSHGVAYTRIPIEPAVESAVVALEWSFWQYVGVSACSRVPSTSASDDSLWAFLDEVSPPRSNSDERVAKFDAYYFQAHAQLGFPTSAVAYLEPFRRYSDDAYPGRLPTAAPVYDGGVAMTDIDEWVRTEGSRLLFVYGEWDPWTGGKFLLGRAADSAAFTEAEGTHGADLGGLAAADRQAAYAKLEAWTGVTPRGSTRSRRLHADTLREHRLPPAMLMGR